MREACPRHLPYHLPHRGRRHWRGTAPFATAVLGLVGITSSSVAQPPGLSVPTAWIDRAAPVIEAARAYRDTNGLWPWRLADTGIENLGGSTAGWTYRWAPDGQCVLLAEIDAASGAADRNVDAVAYVFGSPEAGWYVRSGGQFLATDPVPAVYRPLRNPTEPQTRRAIAEFDRRIREEPHNPVHRAAKCSWLYFCNKLDYARAAAVEWVEAEPLAHDPRCAIVIIERKRLSGLGYLAFPDSWARRPHPSLAVWFMFNKPYENTEHLERIDDALALPLAGDRAQWYVAEAALNVVIDRLCSRRGRYSKAIPLCDRWEAAAQERDHPTDASYLALRAYAHLRLEQFDAARQDALAAIREEQRGRLSSGNAAELLHAIERRESKYEYDSRANQFLYGAHWLIDAE